jgi:hypothetical protein
MSAFFCCINIANFIQLFYTARSTAVAICLVGVYKINILLSFKLILNQSIFKTYSIHVQVYLKHIQYTNNTLKSILIWIYMARIANQRYQVI